jgi:glucose-1-phosphate adenylyltransferase
LAGGSGSRLVPLTRNRAKPAVPFGGKYRIIDVVMSQLFYSKIPKTVVIPQYRLRSLNNHVQEVWTPKGGIERRITTAPPSQGGGRDWYKGTADAIVHNLDEVYEYGPDHVAIFAADHITDLDITEFLRSHHESPRDLTIAAEIREVKEEDFERGKDEQIRYKYGVIEVGDNFRVKGFREKPQIKDMKLGDRAFVSMGNYFFESEQLVIALGKNYGLDFGNHVIPGMHKDGARIFVFPFKGYWRDVGDLGSYYQSSRELLLDNPPLNLHKLWEDKRPILTSGTGRPPTIFGNSGKRSLLSEGCYICRDVSLESSIISPGVEIGRNSQLDGAIVFEDVTIGEGSQIQDTIIDKHNRIPANSKIGYDTKEDKSKGYSVVQYQDQKVTVVSRANPPGRK